jgi:hypothetical protein
MYKKTVEIKDFFKEFTVFCYENLRATSMYREVRDRRGFTDELMEQYMVGKFDKITQKWLTTYYDNDMLIDAGMLNKKGNFYFQNRIVYPYFNERGEPCYFIYRLIDKEPDFMEKAKYIKQMKTKHVEETLFGLDSLPKFRDKPLVITEGITDAISVIQSGFPCLSPVTVKFKSSDAARISHYAKRFEAVVIVNDVEDNDRGLKGALSTLVLLLEKGINAKIGIIPNPEELDKIDLDVYLHDDGANKLERLMTDAIDGFEYLIEHNLDTDEGLRDLLKVIPNKKVMMKKDIFDKIKKKTGVLISDLNKLYKEVQQIKSEEERKAKEEVKEDVKQVHSEMTDLIDSFFFRGHDVEVRQDGVWNISIDLEGNLREKKVFKGILKLIHKTRYLGQDYFTYEHNGQSYNTMLRTLIFTELKHFTYGGIAGGDVLKYYFELMNEKLEYKECKPILGFDDGWVLPFLEYNDTNDYKILSITDLQRKAYNNCKTIVKEYDDDQKEKLCELLKDFILTTQMHKDKIATIIGWSIASVFKLSFLRYYGLFPGLMLQGDKQSGKTYFASMFTTHFFKAWNTYLSGATIKSEARCEDILATSTFPVHLDELEYVKYSIIEILKSTLTGIHDYVRKLNVINNISKPEIAPFCITTNQAPRPFLDPALNSKMIMLNYTSEEQIVDDPKWMLMFDKLKNEHMFSLLYEHTKHWTHKDIIKVIRGVEPDIIGADNNSRLKKKHVVVKFGLKLFNDIFGIDLDKWYDYELVESGERLISADLLNVFVTFCNNAMHYNDNDYKNKRYLTSLLHETDKEYIFSADNLRDFNEYTNEKFTLRQLGNLLNDAIRNKKLLYYGKKYLYRKQVRCIVISKKVFKTDDIEEL